MECVDFLVVCCVDADKVPRPVSFLDVPNRPYVEYVDVGVYSFELIICADDDVVGGSVICVEVIWTVGEHQVWVVGLKGTFDVLLSYVFVVSELSFWYVEKRHAVPADDIVCFFTFFSSEVSYIAWFKVRVAELAVAHDEGVHVVTCVVEVGHRATYSKDLIVAVRAYDQRILTHPYG